MSTIRFLFYNSLRHAICSFIFVDHLCMILLFNLDIGQQFPKCGIRKCKHIGIIFTGHQLLCSDTICREKRIMLLILRIIQCPIRHLWLIVFALCIVAIARRNRTI